MPIRYTLQQVKDKLKEKDLLMGLVLGDGSIYKDKRYNSYELYIGHGEKQKDYLEWKLNILNNSGVFENKIKEKSKIIKSYITQCKSMEEKFNFLTEYYN